MAPVALVLDRDPQLHHSMVVTAQHRGLLDDVLGLFNLKPQHDLDLMRPGQSLEYIMSAALTGLVPVLEELRPDFVLVHGDTTTTFAAALAAFYTGIPVGHVEAGLRTTRIAEPFPEEFNRRATDLLAAHYYCPTQRSLDTIRRSADCTGLAFLTGNTSLDAVRLCYKPDFEFSDPLLADFVSYAGPRLLVTAHRRENWGERMEQICLGLMRGMEEFPDARACFCWHPNPAVRETVQSVLAGHPRVLLLDPPRYDSFVNLLARCHIVLSDSGGIQEEVTQLGLFVLILRNLTERPEAVDAGYARVIGTDEAGIVSALRSTLPACLSGQLLRRSADGSLRRSPFGDGYAAEKIVSALRLQFGLDPES